MNSINLGSQSFFQKTVVMWLYYIHWMLKNKLGTQTVFECVWFYTGTIYIAIFLGYE